jgi:hypothetical protein
MGLLQLIVIICVAVSFPAPRFYEEEEMVDGEPTGVGTYVRTDNITFRHPTSYIQAHKEASRNNTVSAPVALDNGSTDDTTGVTALLNTSTTAHPDDQDDLAYVTSTFVDYLDNLFTKADEGASSLKLPGNFTEIL